MTEELGKWPRLVVVGDNVTVQQAMEIIVRTDSGYLHGNDKAWERACHRILGLPYDDYTEPKSSEERQAIWEAEAKAKEELRQLRLSSLSNSQIISSYIGGPHGWVDWLGNVGTSSYNVGKWPSKEGILSDAKTLAEAFPYLNLKIQLVGDEGEGEVLYQLEISDGEAREVEIDTDTLTELSETDVSGLFRSFQGLNPFRERGVSEAQLREAARLARGVK